MPVPSFQFTGKDMSYSKINVCPPDWVMHLTYCIYAVFCLNYKKA